MVAFYEDVLYKMTGKVFCVALETTVLISIFAHNRPQPHTPSTIYLHPCDHHIPSITQTPQPPTPHNHPHPSHPSNHTPPKTTGTLIPKLHTLQNHAHPSNPTAHTHQPHTLATHISQPPTPDASPSCTNEYIGTR